jgi:hypothetical protein
LQHWIETNKVERKGNLPRTYLPIKDVSGSYLAPVPLEFPGKSGDSFVAAHLHPACLAALSFIYEQMAAQILAISRGMLRCKEDAEEIVVPRMAAAMAPAELTRADRNAGGEIPPPGFRIA